MNAETPILVGSMLAELPAPVTDALQSQATNIIAAVSGVAVIAAPVLLLSLGLGRTWKTAKQIIGVHHKVGGAAYGAAKTVRDEIKGWK